jgi:hypothetical protein
MNDKAVIMKKEIRAVAYYQALIISKRLLSILLLLMSLYLGLLRFPMSPLYVLLFLNALPFVISYASKEYSKKNQNRILLELVKDDPFLLSTLKKKYKYTKLRYMSNSVSYLFSLFLIGLWQYSYRIHYYIPDNLQNIPVLFLSSSLLVRLIGIIFYQWKLPYDLSHNKL